MHEVEIRSIADGEVGKGIVGYNPIIAGQLTREEIDLWVEDFENGQGDWFLSPGWNITNSDSNSPTNSANSPNNATTSDGTHDLITPVISLPALGDGETMNFSFYLKADMPDADGDGDNSDSCNGGGDSDFRTGDLVDKSVGAEACGNKGPYLFFCLSMCYAYLSVCLSISVSVCLLAVHFSSLLTPF